MPGAAGAAGETATLSCESADVTRKKYVAPGVSPVSVRECAVTRAADAELLESEPAVVP